VGLGDFSLPKILFLHFGQCFGQVVERFSKIPKGFFLMGWGGFGCFYGVKGKFDTFYITSIILIKN
jgi:hypothetical protein